MVVWWWALKGPRRTVLRAGPTGLAAPTDRPVALETGPLAADDRSGVIAR